MLLAIDVRNRSLAVGFREGGAWLARRRFGVSVERSADEYAYLFRAAFAEACAAAEAAAAKASAATATDGPGSAAPEAAAGIVVGSTACSGAAAPVDRAIISSVAPALTPRLVEAAMRAFGVTALVVGPGTRTGVKIRSDLPQEVGSDLVCGAAAAQALVPGTPCVVVDFGGAITFSAISAAGEFLGAAIAPGLDTAALSLHAAAALLPEVRAEAPARAIGRTTFASIQSGLHFGYQGLVERLVSLFRAELAGPGHPAASIELLATGDEAGRALVASLDPRRFVPDLALEGLAIIAERLSR